MNDALLFVDYYYAPIKLTGVTGGFSNPLVDLVCDRVFDRLKNYFLLSSQRLVEVRVLSKGKDVFVGGTAAQLFQPQVDSFIISQTLILGWFAFGLA